LPACSFSTIRKHIAPSRERPAPKLSCFIIVSSSIGPSWRPRSEPEPALPSPQAAGGAKPSIWRNWIAEARCSAWRRRNLGGLDRLDVAVLADRQDAALGRIFLAAAGASFVPFIL
jgi:hypothetical protein